MINQENKYLSDVTSIIDFVFTNKQFDDSNEKKFNDLMFLDKQLNYHFLSSYIDGLRDKMQKDLKSTSYEELMNDFIPSFKESMKHSSSSYILFSLQSFDRFLSSHPSNTGKESFHKEVCVKLTQENSHLPWEYKEALSVRYPQFYKIKKGKAFYL